MNKINLKLFDINKIMWDWKLETYNNRFKFQKVHNDYVEICLLVKGNE